MIEKVEISDVAKETIEIINYFNTEFVSKIPQNFLELLKELAKESRIVVKVDKNKKLKEQDISDQCKDLISLIYYSYIATENEKKEIIKIWRENELSE